MGTTREYRGSRAAWPPRLSSDFPCAPARSGHVLRVSQNPATNGSLLGVVPTCQGRAGPPARHDSITSRQRVFVILKATDVVVVLGSCGPREISMDATFATSTRRLRTGVLRCRMARRSRTASANARGRGCCRREIVVCPKRPRGRGLERAGLGGAPHSNDVRSTARQNVSTSRAFDATGLTRRDMPNADETCPTPMRHAQRLGVGCGRAEHRREGEERNGSSCADFECRGGEQMLEDGPRDPRAVSHAFRLQLAKAGHQRWSTSRSREVRARKSAWNRRAPVSSNEEIVMNS
ncbi:hypothetical protein OH76DRAFT_1022762 [Lentinus brumalis]|uniref:Uncharacterized protein n=1 Tax=Lentinus brumalis TaxID=2498619 RepID=A0A371CXZ4_9APHY|nr:hypothetical protein OH76DRAFT_1022762 [Polyporus brumalis]